MLFLYSGRSELQSSRHIQAVGIKARGVCSETEQSCIMVSHSPKDCAVPSLDLICIMASLHCLTLMPPQQTLLQRLEKRVFLAHMADINVGLHVEKPTRTLIVLIF